MQLVSIELIQKRVNEIDFLIEIKRKHANMRKKSRIKHLIEQLKNNYKIIKQKQDNIDIQGESDNRN